MDPSAPGWYPDPTGRHERRYWSGIRWSRHVDNGGERGDDPIEPDSTEHLAVQSPTVPALPDPPQLGIQQYQPSYDRFQPPAPLPRSRAPLIALAGVVAAAVIGIGVLLITGGGGGDDDNKDDSGLPGQGEDDELMEYLVEFNLRATGETATPEEARCMARNSLGQIPRERWLELDVLQEPNPLVLLEPDEVVTVVVVGYDCLSDQGIIDAMASTWSSNETGGITREIAPCFYQGLFDKWGRTEAVENYGQMAKMSMPDSGLELTDVLTPEELADVGNVIVSCNEQVGTTTTTADG